MIGQIKKKIFLFTSSLSFGGAEKVISNLSNEFSTEFEVYLIIYKRSSNMYSFSGKVYELDTLYKPKKIKLINFFKRLFYFNEIIKKEKPDIVLSFLDSPNFINVFSSNTKKKLISIRNSNLKLITYLYVFLSSFTSTKVICVSDFINRKLSSIFFWKKDFFITINNFVNISEIKAATLELISPQLKKFFEKPVVTFVGRLEKQKNLTFLIYLAKYFSKFNSNINFLIIGQGSLKVFLERKIKQLNLESSVFLLGFQNNPYNFIANSQLLILTSKFEGFPNVLIEAMACSTPIMTYNCKSGINEIFGSDKYKDPFGIVLKNFKLSNWFKSINLVLNEKNQKDFRTQARLRALKFSKEIILKKWLEVL
jgi:glycosyltransferase involved in cell wall biosynthesis